MSRPIVVINGPNLNRLGQREPGVYGAETLNQINTRISERAARHGIPIEFFQSNLEGALIDRIHGASGALGVIFNPGGYSHTSVALRDAVASIAAPVVEVHMTNIHAREEFRHQSLISGACRGVITGLGADGYLYAVDYIASVSQTAP
ncbi:MAG TPA: type II 3-dehydroquinate dehydratase [candidate division Zixibacteria bacterium]|jgi:3-dehydroquinate dehydratase-2